MVVIFKCSDPYIASRNLEPKDWKIVFEGDLKSCKNICSACITKIAATATVTHQIKPKRFATLNAILTAWRSAVAAWIMIQGFGKS